MTRLVVDRETLSRLGPLDKPLELCDESGHTLGFFKPLENREAYRQYKSLLSPEEVARRMKIKEGRTLKEIHADLEHR